MKNKLSAAIAVAGYGEVSKANAEALLDDFLPASSSDFVIFVPPGFPGTPSAQNITEWLDHNDIKYTVSVDLVDSLVNSGALSEYLIVLSPENLGELTAGAVKNRIPVLDLTRGLFDISSQIPPYVPESHAEPLTGDSGTLVKVLEYGGAESLSELRAVATTTQKELMQYMAGLIRIHEEKFHGQMAQMASTDKSPPDSPRSELATGPESGTEFVEDSSKIKCYQTEDGKVRKAGKLKIKPGEKIVYLTEGELSTV